MTASRRLAAPDGGWRHREGMDPRATARYRAGIVARARAAGFTDARHVSAATLNRLYFAGRPDGLRTSNVEELFVATT
ncbi:hypothetical protein OG949_17355 [Streptomyces scopuliridis]|uniref:hypothetical protein n=1 Tax=Streptomyces scopuliridis TaxID=452529 RepID=UPI002DDC4E80|nr:hypothetical protein [Streptomyces scopuliridis]WSB34467.1 hypothetical protein OG949_17355 [Streptomyces scopuliridis]